MHFLFQILLLNMSTTYCKQCLQNDNLRKKWFCFRKKCSFRLCYGGHSLDDSTLNVLFTYLETSPAKKIIFHQYHTYYCMSSSSVYNIIAIHSWWSAIITYSSTDPELQVLVYMAFPWPGRCKLELHTVWGGRPAWRAKVGPQWAGRWGTETPQSWRQAEPTTPVWTLRKDTWEGMSWV